MNTFPHRKKPNLDTASRPDLLGYVTDTTPVDALYLSRADALYRSRADADAGLPARCGYFPSCTWDGVPECWGRAAVAGARSGLARRHAPCEAYARRVPAADRPGTVQAQR